MIALSPRQPPSPAEICWRHQLELVDVCHEGGTGSYFVTRVRNRGGQQFVLKHTYPWKRSEIAALRAWSATGMAARFVAELEPGVFLAEWLSGPSLADAVAYDPGDLRAVGNMLRVLHQVPLPDDLLRVRARFDAGVVTGWWQLTPEMIALGEQVAVQLRLYEPGCDVLLHGDLVPSNVILTDSGPKVIDPAGHQGLRSWDVAQLAVAAAERGRQDVLGHLLAGYDQELPLLADVLAWTILYYLRNSIAAGRAERIRHLRPLAEALVAVGDAASFLDQYLHQRFSHAGG